MPNTRRVLLLDADFATLPAFLAKLEDSISKLTEYDSARLCDTFDLIAAAPEAWAAAAQLASGNHVRDLRETDYSAEGYDLLHSDKKTELCLLTSSYEKKVQAQYWYRAANGEIWSDLPLPKQLPPTEPDWDVSWALFQLLISGILGFVSPTGEENLLLVTASTRKLAIPPKVSGELPPPTLLPFLAKDSSYDFLLFPKNGVPADGFSGHLELLTLLRYRATAPEQLESSHIESFFAEATPTKSDIIRFQANQRPDLPFKKAVKKAIPIEVCEIDQPFVVETMEGPLQGKAGDFLMIGVQGEMYPCDREIFFETYDFVS